MHSGAARDGWNRRESLGSREVSRGNHGSLPVPRAGRYRPMLSLCSMEAGRAGASAFPPLTAKLVVSFEM